MIFLSRMPLLRALPLLAATALCTAGFAGAQFASSPNHSSSTSYPSFSSTAAPAASSDSSSSSLDGTGDLVADFAAPEAPAGKARTGGQYRDNGGRYNPRPSRFSHLTFEAGGGFNAPTSESSPYITWGGNLTLGAGYRFNPYVSLMTEYQFIDDKLPGAIIAEAGSDGGHAHIWSLTLAPVIDLFPHDTNSVYVTGGGGFYRKVTSFTDPAQTEYCDYFYCYIGTTNVVVGHFSSNQGGWNVGTGFTHRIGGMYGDGKLKLFAEVRYLDIDTPGVYTQPNGLSTTVVAPKTRLIPVTLGIRW